MRFVFIDPEPPTATGGGIRTYLRLMESQLLRSGHACIIFSHTPQAYAGDARAIGRLPYLPRLLRMPAYRWLHAEVVLTEQSRWLREELLPLCDGQTLFEFADFLGYAFFPLRNSRLRKFIVVRVHTPAFLIPFGRQGIASSCERMLCSRRERWVLRRAQTLTAPSRAFMQEKLPGFPNFRYLPNPPPQSENPAPTNPPQERYTFLYLGRMEPRKGTHILLSAFEELLESRPQARLTLAGEGGDSLYGKTLMESVNRWPAWKKDRVQWLPGQSPAEVTRMLGEHAFLVTPSLWENSPYVFFEAISAGRVSIGTLTGEMGSILEECDSPRATPGNIASLTTAMETVLSPQFGYAEHSRLQKKAMGHRQSRAVQGFFALAGEIVDTREP